MTCSEGRLRPAALLLAAALLAAPLHAVKRRAFVTSVTGTGDLSSWPDAGGHAGLDAGDAICRAHAANAGLPNADTYRSWLSTSTTDAWCHVQGLTGKKATGCNGAPLPGAGPWYLSNGITNFTPDLATLTGPAQVIYRPVTTDEFGNAVPTAEQWYWTGTNADGAANSQTCQDWTSGSVGYMGVEGSALATTGGWTHYYQSTCDTASRLLCVEPGASEATPLGWSPAALVFVSSAQGTGNLSTWAQAGGQAGLAAGDAVCRNLAATAHLPAPESFVAWLSDGGADAIDRLTVGELVPFRRVDGYGIGAKSNFRAGFTFNSIHVDERGHYLMEMARAWTGTDGAGQAMTDRCADWQSSAAPDYGGHGAAFLARESFWTDINTDYCYDFARLYCFSNVVTVFWDGFDYTGDTSRWSSSVP